MKIIHALLSTALLTGTFTTSAIAAPSDNAPSTAEKSWTHTGSIGFAAPVSKFKTGGKDVGTVGFGLDLNYIGMARNGFSIGASFAGGASATDDIKFEGSKDDSQTGRFTAFDIGLGYTFGAGKKFSVSVLGTVGFEIAYFESEKNEYKHEELGKVDKYFTETLGGLALGGDVVVYKGLSERAGIYASIAGRWLAKSASISTTNYEKGDDTRTDTHADAHSGLYSIVPAVGAMFNF